MVTNQAYSEAVEQQLKLAADLAKARQALEQIERLAREGSRDGHLIRDAIQEIAAKALA